LAVTQTAAAGAWRPRIIEAGDADERQRAIDVSADDLQHPMDSLLAIGGEGQEPGPAAQCRGGAEGLGLHHVSPPAHAAVDQHLNSAGDGVGDLGHAPAVVR